MLTAGLTGGLGSGKSAVADVLRNAGAHRIDADALARELLAPDSEVLTEVVATFGNGIVDAQGRLDRRLLGERIFANPDERAALEAILHPRINRLAQERIAAIGRRYPEAVVVYEAPLLIESGAHRWVDRVLVVDADEATQMARVQARDGRSAEQVWAMMAAQLPRDQRLAYADDVIDNNGQWHATREQAELLMERYRAQARRASP